MKKVILGLGLIVYNLCAGQTTMQEYNYMTNGYVIQLQTGQDINKGYTVKKIGDFAIDVIDLKAKRVSEFYSVYIASSASPAEPIGVWVKLFRNDTLNKYVSIFVPNKKAGGDVMDQAFADFLMKFRPDGKYREEELIAMQNHSWNFLKMISSLNTK